MLEARRLLKRFYGHAVVDDVSFTVHAGEVQQLAYDLTRDRRVGGNQADVNRAYNEHWMDARR